MKKVFFYLLFCVLTHQSFGQMPLMHAQNNDLNAPDFSVPRLLSHARPAQSRNFVELQLDSIVYTWFDSVGQTITERRFLYSYSGDSTVIQILHSNGGIQTYEYRNTLVYNALNVVIFDQYTKVLPGGQLWNLSESQYFYNPTFPHVLDSIRVSSKEEGSPFSRLFLEKYSLVPGTALTQSSFAQWYSNGILSSELSVTYSYDGQQREVQRLAEIFDFGTDVFRSYRKNTEYTPDASVAVSDERGEGETIWTLRSKVERAFFPGTQRRKKEDQYNWSAASQEWVPHWKYLFTYDNDERPVEEVLDAYINGLFFVKSGIKTNYVQDNYTDKNVYYTFYYGDSTVYATEQFYYAMPSSTTQPHTETAQVELAPNPAHAYLRARTEQNIQLAELYDLQGRLVMNIATDGTNVLHVHRNNLPSGIYALRLQLENGATVSERVQWE